MAYTEIVNGKRRASDTLSKYRALDLTYTMWSEIMVEMGFKYKTPIFHKSPWTHSRDSDFSCKFLSDLYIVVELRGSTYSIVLGGLDNAQESVDNLLRFIRKVYENG